MQTSLRQYLFLLLALLYTNGNADHYLILSGLAWHSEDKNFHGREYDTFIEGIGYQYTSEGHSYTVMALNDSNSNFMPSITYGHSWQTIEHISVGLDIGVGYRTLLTEDDSYQSVIPIVIPKIVLDIDQLIMNIGLIPPIKTDTLNVTGAVYINFGLKI